MYYLKLLYNYYLMIPNVLVTLIIFMMVEITTFFILTHFFDNKLNKQDIYKNVAKKFVMLLLVIMVYRVDLFLKTPYLYSVYVAFISNEVILIIENVTLMGLPVPRTIINIVSIFKSRNEEIKEKEPLGLESIEPIAPKEDQIK